MLPEKIRNFLLKLQQMFFHKKDTSNLAFCYGGGESVSHVKINRKYKMQLT